MRNQLLADFSFSVFNPMMLVQHCSWSQSSRLGAWHYVFNLDSYNKHSGTKLLVRDSRKSHLRAASKPSTKLSRSNG